MADRHPVRVVLTGTPSVPRLSASANPNFALRLNTLFPNLPASWNKSGLIEYERFGCGLYGP